MNTTVIHSLSEFQEKNRRNNRFFLLIYKAGSEQSDIAHANIAEAASGLTDIEIYTADVNQVRDIHPEYSISSVPALLEFENRSFKNVIKGAHSPGFYQGLFENAVFIAKAEKEGKPVRRVTVYSTPTCSWCTTLKSYLRKNGIRYTDIDVSRNEEAAQEMVNRSGQQGVPQTLIDGEMVIGFDKSKINRLLEIEG